MVNKTESARELADFMRNNSSAARKGMLVGNRRKELMIKGKPQVKDR